MKHLKQYESVIKTDFENLQFGDTIIAYRSILSADKLTQSSITKTIGNDEFILDVGKIQSINYQPDKERQIYYGTKFSEGYFYILPKYIIFASDRTKDAIDQIKIIISANKYNL